MRETGLIENCLRNGYGEAHERKGALLLCIGRTLSVSHFSRKVGNRLGCPIDIIFAFEDAKHINRIALCRDSRAIADSPGLVAEKRYADGSSVCYTYGDDGKLTSRAWARGVTTTYAYDAYGYNARSELTNAVKNATLNEYAYRYDDIGNRETAFERGTNFTYEANKLNQYTTVERNSDQYTTVGRGLRAAPLDDAFSPTYDLDGNQTLVKTKTGIWSVTYNGENRPVLWECGSTNIVMKFDRMGRRVEYVEAVGTVTNRHQKFVYDGYLCIQRLNGTNNSITELFEWDPTEPVATRPMFMQYRVPGQTYALFYTHDGNKNVSEVVHFSRANGVAAHYEYAPFGEVTAQIRQGGITAYDFAALNPWRFSSEYADDASATVYYNYRHYEPVMGRWMQRDPIEEEDSVALYVLVENRLENGIDYLGAAEVLESGVIDVNPHEVRIIDRKIGVYYWYHLETVYDKYKYEVIGDKSCDAFKHAHIQNISVSGDYVGSIDSFGLGLGRGAFSVGYDRIYSVESVVRPPTTNESATCIYLTPLSRRNLHPYPEEIGIRVE